MKVVRNEPEFQPFSILVETKEDAQLLFSLLGAVSYEIERHVTGKVIDSYNTYIELKRILGEDAVPFELAVTSRGKDSR